MCFLFFSFFSKWKFFVGKRSFQPRNKRLYFVLNDVTDNLSSFLCHFVVSYHNAAHHCYIFLLKVLKTSISLYLAREARTQLKWKTASNFRKVNNILKFPVKREKFLFARYELSSLWCNGVSTIPVPIEQLCLTNKQLYSIALAFFSPTSLAFLPFIAFKLFQASCVQFIHIWRQVSCVFKRELIYMNNLIKWCSTF